MRKELRKEFKKPVEVKAGEKVTIRITAELDPCTLIPRRIKKVRIEPSEGGE